MPYLYTKNHIVTTGITDLISMLTILFKKHSLELDQKKKKDDVILFIEEFSDYFELKKILDLKKKNNFKFIVVSTEFETKNRHGCSFNAFQENNLITEKIINFFSIILFYIPKSLRKFKSLSKIASFIIYLFSCLNKNNNQNNKSIKFSSNKLSEIKRQIYMKTRRKGFEVIKKHTELIIKVHPLLNENKNDFTIYPPISRKITSNKKTIKVSGTETNYRLNKCYDFQNKLKDLKIKYKFYFDSKITFNVGSNNNFGFSYQPAQSEGWNKSNPIKIWRDIWIHNAIPIVDKKFNDHIIENLTITTYDFFNNLVENRKVLEQQKKYMNITRKLNHDLFEKIKKLITM